MTYSLNSLYKEVGLSKQAVAQYDTRQKLFDKNVEQMARQADKLRVDHPGCGVAKMYSILNPQFLGRDRFVDTMMELGYRLKRRKNYRKTTRASKIYFPNLIKGVVVNKPSMIWQSDITYIPVGSRHYYAVFIIDVYTKKIVGYNVADNMRAKANVAALEMALEEHLPPKIHHSDRGGQYIYSEYIKLLHDKKSEISMAKSAQDNAYAERINRTIKEEYLDHWKPKDFNALKRAMKKAVTNYNHVRIHDNLPKMSPVSFEKHLSKLKIKDRPKLVIYDNEGINHRVYNIPTTHKPNNESLASY